MSVIVGCDFSIKTVALAGWDNGDLDWWGKHKLGAIETRKLLEDYYEPGAIFAIEDVFYNPRKPNIKTVIHLAKVGGDLRRIALDIGYKVIWVKNAEWTATLPGVTKTPPRKVCKAKSVWLAQQLTGDPTLKDEDIADAINIGGYQARRTK